MAGNLFLGWVGTAIDPPSTIFKGIGNWEFLKVGSSQVQKTDVGISSGEPIS